MTDTTTTLNPAAPRRSLLLGAGLLAAAVAAAAAAWSVASGKAAVSTDDAYVGGHVVPVTPQVAGTVTAVLADNADRVRAGQALVELDGADARIELAAARAALDAARRRVDGLFAAEAERAALVAVRRLELERARSDLAARRDLAEQGAVTGEETRHAQDAVRAAQAALDAARHAQALAAAQTRGVTPDTHPDIAAAGERVRAAALALERTVVRAPVDGMVTGRTVQLGRRLAPGERMLALVPMDRLWVDANFKEVQLRDICPGQPVRLVADVYGERVVYHGTVYDAEAGTGAAFAPLPPQNASGNWIKVVQRVPVRVALDPQELSAHPLRIGLSMQVEVDMRDGGEAPLSAAAPAPVASTEVFADLGKAARERIRAIISANNGGQPAELPELTLPTIPPAAAGLATPRRTRA